MKVSVFGLGYVGAVSCGCLAQDGHDVIGVDVNVEKANLINEGRTPILEDRIGDIVSDAVKQGRLRATTDASEAVLATELSIVCVGTPSQSNGRISMEAVRRVSAEIGAALRGKRQRHLVVVRSTVLPGTIRSIVVPVLEEASGKSLRDDGFGVCFNPEFLREGSSVRDYYEPPFVLVGSSSATDAAIATALYSKVHAEVHVTSIEAAELIKYVCNAFHALKIAFANEVGNFSQAVGVDSFEVMRLVCKDTKLNISPRYLRPGFAFGGSCLPKDMRALLYEAREHDIELPVLRAVLESNRLQIARVIDRVLSYRRKKVTMLGLSFKAGTDDLRESPLVSLAEAMIGKGLDLRIYDSSVSLARLVGANRSYIEHEIPHISSLLMTDLRCAVEHGDIIVIGNNAAEFGDIAELCRDGQSVIDLVGIPDLSKRASVSYWGVNW